MLIFYIKTEHHGSKQLLVESSHKGRYNLK